jgi:UDP-glucose 4-epimerase
MRALVTGAAGFIGSHLVDALAESGHSVRVLDDLSTGLHDNLHPGAEVVLGDVADEDVVRDAVEGVEVVFHQAAHRAVLRSVDHPLATDRANTLGTLTVLKAASENGVRRVVYASSSSIYGNVSQAPVPETARPMPRSPYAVTKLSGEHYCRVFAELYGIETVALRYFNVYGPRQRPDSAYAAVIPLFIDALTTGASPEVHGDGRQSRDFTYIDDVVTANLAAAYAPAELCSGMAYNIAGGAAYTLLELLDVLGGILEVEPHPVHTSPRPGDVRHTRADIGAARRDLGHEPKVAFPQGLERMVEWFALNIRAVEV